MAEEDCSGDETAQANADLLLGHVDVMAYGVEGQEESVAGLLGDEDAIRCEGHCVQDTDSDSHEQKLEVNEVIASDYLRHVGVYGVVSWNPRFKRGRGVQAAVALLCLCPCKF